MPWQKLFTIIFNLEVKRDLKQKQFIDWNRQKFADKGGMLL